MFHGGGICTDAKGYSVFQSTSGYYDKIPDAVYLINSLGESSPRLGSVIVLGLWQGMWMEHVLEQMSTFKLQK